MSALLQRRPMTREEFLAWDEAQEGRHEFDGTAPVAMVGGSVAHASITRNLLGRLWQSLRGKACQPFGGDLRVEAAGRIRYPDAAVSCTPAGRGALAIRDPVVVFEVLSPSTAMIDTTQKNLEYRSVASIRRYVMLNQDRMAILLFAREAEAWVGSVVAGADATLDMPEIGVCLKLPELYEGVAMEAL